MHEAGVPAPLNVIVVSDDADFRRLATAGLARSGYAVRSTGRAETQLPRLLRATPADVVVVEGDPALAETRAVLGANTRVGIVHVKPEGALGVTKWGPLSALAAEVLVAAEEAAAAPPVRSLRIVS
jgi:hypothetical protein